MRATCPYSPLKLGTEDRKLVHESLFFCGGVQAMLYPLNRRQRSQSGGLEGLVCVSSPPVLQWELGPRLIRQSP